VDGSFYIRKWFFDQIMNLSLEVTGTLYTTLYLRPWLNSLGAKFGPRSEISTIRFIHPDLLEAGAECFLADDVSVGAPEVRGGWMTIRKIVVGDRTFVGNSALLPPGASLGNNVLIGVLSALPGKDGETVPDGTSWLGSPAINLPSRLKAQGFSEAQTYRPPRRLVALRLFIEFFRIILPSTIFVVLASLIINTTDILQDYIGLREWLALLPLMYMAAGALAVLATLLFKKALIGAYRKEIKPLWCAFVWRSELVTGLYENLSGCSSWTCSGARPSSLTPSGRSASRQAGAVISTAPGSRSST
jgi:non-ribosomal peptide synthetase-like protein